MAQRTLHPVDTIEPAGRLRRKIDIGRPGFTVVELLISIVVLAIVSVGLSVIFSSISDAVADGRRVSELNRASARIEMQIRDDLSRLTRDGFLVITNRYASDEQGRVFTSDSGIPNTAPPPSGSPQPQGVRLSPADIAPRARRADEIIFFARGNFVSKRAPLVSGVDATASEAAIYYGIGQKRPLSFAPNNNFFFNPRPSDFNAVSESGTRYRPLLGVPEPSGQFPNPNRYAANWSLLRQVTLLAEPQLVPDALPADLYGISRTDPQERTLLFDSARQIALQPAARSIFNSLGWTDPGEFSGSATAPLPGADLQNRWRIADIATPSSERATPSWRASGTIDIAQGSILGIRRQLEALATYEVPRIYHAPSEVVNNPGGAPGSGETADFFQAEWLDPSASPRPTDARNLQLSSNPTHRANMLAWALDMMPSLWNGEGRPPLFLAGVRYEDLPTRLVYEQGEFGNTDAGRLGRALAETNQEMLTAQVFVPRCSEFIVEWTYGSVDPSLGVNDPRFKQLVWYGLPRADRDDNGDGRIDLGDHAVPANRITRRFGLNTIPGEPDREEVALAPIGATLTGPEVVVFGLNNIEAASPPAAGSTVTIDPIPWPALIRITMSLADPEDDTIERTYQFVFSVPGEQN